jgi:hypothetical protein
LERTVIVDLANIGLTPAFQPEAIRQGYPKIDPNPK